MKHFWPIPKTIPNMITILRILLVPLFVWRYMSAQQPIHYYTAAAILIFSSITDILDGVIARRTNTATDWGMAMDPFADKLTQLALVGCLWVRHPSLWPFYAIIVIKELILIFGSLVLLSKISRINGALWYGKINTVVFTLLMLYIVAAGEVTAQQLKPAMIIILGAMIFSGLLYIIRFFNTLSKKRIEKAA